MEESIILNVNASVVDTTKQGSPVIVDVEVLYNPDMIEACVSNSPKEWEEITSSFNDDLAELIAKLMLNIKLLKEKENYYVN